MQHRGGLNETGSPLQQCWSLSGLCWSPGRLILLDVPGVLGVLGVGLTPLLAPGELPLGRGHSLGVSQVIMSVMCVRNVMFAQNYFIFK